MQYLAYLHKESKSDFGVSFPDFPGAVTAGKNLDEALRFAIDVLKLHIRGMLKDGEALPEPSTLARLERDPDRKDAVVFLVDVPLPDKLQRVNITAHKSQWDKIDALAKARGLKRSTYMVQAATEPESVKK
jgi:predicted RNase H-like HicB family nuclease